MYHLTLNKKKSRWEARNFGNARNGQKKFWPPPGSVWIVSLHPLQGASWIACCRLHFALNFLPITTHWTKYSVFIFSRYFVFAFRWLTFFTFSIQGFGRFIENGQTTFCNVSINKNQTIIHHVFLELQLARNWYWKFPDSFNVVQLLRGFFYQESRILGHSNLLSLLQSRR